MLSFSLLSRYFLWHYTEALYDLITICRGLALFWLNFWGVRYFIETLGEPLGFRYENFVLDLFSRLAGLVVRFVFITVGAVGAVVMVPISLVVVVGWLFYPLFVLSLIILGGKFLIYG